MPAPTDRQIADAYRSAILANPGATSVTIDGITTTFASPSEMRGALEFWEKRAAIAEGRRPRVAQINLGGAQ